MSFVSYADRINTVENSNNLLTTPFKELNFIDDFIDHMVKGAYGDGEAIRLLTDGASFFSSKNRFLARFLIDLLNHGPDPRQTAHFSKIPANVYAKLSVGNLSYNSASEKSNTILPVRDDLVEALQTAVDSCPLLDSAYKKICKHIDDRLQLYNNNLQDLAYAVVKTKPDLAFAIGQLAATKNNNEIMGRVIEIMTVHNTEKAKDFLQFLLVTDEKLYTYVWDYIGETAQNTVQ